MNIIHTHTYLCTYTTTYVRYMHWQDESSQTSRVTHIREDLQSLFAQRARSPWKWQWQLRPNLLPVALFASGEVLEHFWTTWFIWGNPKLFGYVVKNHSGGLVGSLLFSIKFIKWSFPMSFKHSMPAADRNNRCWGTHSSRSSQHPDHPDQYGWVHKVHTRIWRICIQFVHKKTSSLDPLVVPQPAHIR